MTDEDRAGSMTTEEVRPVTPEVVTRKPHLTVRVETEGSQ